VIVLEDIQQALQLVTPYIKRTPLERSQTLSELLGANTYLKLEVFQKTGSFKPRGAFNQILQLDQGALDRGVVALSGGNFAQGVAYAGNLLGVETVICMPDYTPANYITATKSYGASIKMVPDLDAAFVMVKEYQKRGYSFLHPFDSPYQMAGTGTISIEILEDLPEVTDIFISIGGGGLIAGNLVAMKSLKPDVRVWGVETEGSPTMKAALDAGKVVHITPNSLAKTLGSPYIAEDALSLAQQYLEELILVSDQEAIEDQRFLLERTKVLTELAASCTLSAARRVKDRFSEDRHVVLLLCGGNESLENMIGYTKI
jgi:threonine dehydratase